MNYTFPNDERPARARLDALEGTFDPGTIRGLEATGVTTGWRCLEVGAGGGSIARWLADRVGPTGHVLATDLDPRHVEPGARPWVRVLRHDLMQDPLPRDEFDLVHARLVLSHVRDPGDALSRLQGALRPGGVLLVEDFEFVEASDAVTESSTLRAMRALVRASVDPALGATLARRCRAGGLADVTAEARMLLYRCGTPGAEVIRQSFVQLRERLLADGLPPHVYEQDLAALEDQDFEARSPWLWSVRGQRPCLPS